MRDRNGDMSKSDEVSIALDEYPSASFRRIVRTLRLFAKHPKVPVLLEGETGTGKSAFANYIHKWSARAQYRFLRASLSTIEDALIGSNLFGHRAGSFTGAVAQRAGYLVTADGGTLFLDEIGKASPAIQNYLLDVVERGMFWPIGADDMQRVDVRMILASNVPLRRLAAEGRFLPDLYARMEAFRIVLPPLRERRADIPLLVDRHLTHFAAHVGANVMPTISKPLMLALCSAPWPGNVRQLITTVQRLFIESDGASELTLAHCPTDLDFLPPGDREYPLTVDRIREAIVTEHGVSGAARLLGVDRRTIQRRLRGHNEEGMNSA